MPELTVRTNADQTAVWIVYYSELNKAFTYLIGYNIKYLTRNRVVQLAHTHMAMQLWAICW